MNEPIKTNLVAAADLARVSAFIAEHTLVNGDFEAEKDADVGLKVDGTVRGCIRVATGGVIHIGPTGRVEGTTVEADYVFVEGHVLGKIIGRKGVELAASCFVKGEIEYAGSLNMHSLAKVRGGINYSGPDDVR